MPTTIKWIVPNYFNTNEGNDDEIVFDFSNEFKSLFVNKVWNRKFEYGSQTNLKEFNSDDILEAKVTILPRFISGYVNEKRIVQYVQKQFNRIDSVFKTNSYKNWNYNFGVVLFEINLDYSIKSIPTIKQRKNFDINGEFFSIYHNHRALIKEFASLFIAGLHLSFPTHSILNWNDNSLNDGLFYIKSGKKKYIDNSLITNMFMHHILIEKDKLSNVRININGLAKVWHLNLWPLKRFLVAVNSNLVNMDNLLDFLYSLEGMFKKNTSSSFIKTFCALSLSKNKKDALRIKEILEIAYQIRNQIAHGSLFYSGYEEFTLNGKKIVAEDIYWELKTILSQMLILVISKVLNNKNMKNLNFNEDDYYDLVFKKRC